MLRLIVRNVSAAILTLLLTVAAFAQAVSGNISGTVQGTTGAAVPNATVQVDDRELGIC